MLKILLLLLILGLIFFLIFTPFVFERIYTSIPQH